VYVKSRPSDPQKRLVTEDQAKEIEREWSQRFEGNKLARDLADLHVDVAERASVESDFNRQHGRAPTPIELLSEAATAKLARAKTHGDWDSVCTISYKFAVTLYEAGKPHWSVLRDAALAKLQSYRKLGVTKVEISSTGDASCPECRRLDGKVFRIDQAIESPAIPARSCSTWSEPDEGKKEGFCRCLYVPVLDL
jgi:hypothetical protein